MKKLILAVLTLAFFAHVCYADTTETKDVGQQSEKKENRISPAKMTIEELLNTIDSNRWRDDEYREEYLDRARLISVKVKIFAMQRTGERKEKNKKYLSDSDLDMICEPELVVMNGTESRIVCPTELPGLDIELSVSPSVLENGIIMTSVHLRLLGIKNNKTYYPVKEINTTTFIKNGAIVKMDGYVVDLDTSTGGKIKTEVTVVLTTHIVDLNPPRGETTPWISGLDAELLENNEVKIDWSSDVPITVNGIQNYRVYRDTKPITNCDKLKPLTSDIYYVEASYWIDSTKKEKGKTYYYVVTAVNPSGMEQACPPNANFNAKVTIPK